MFTAEILAFAITAALGSCTVPSMRAADCANSGAVIKNVMLRSATNRRTALPLTKRNLCMLPPGEACWDTCWEAAGGYDRGVGHASKGETRSLLLPKRENDGFLGAVGLPSRKFLLSQV